MALASKGTEQGIKDHEPIQCIIMLRIIIIIIIITTIIPRNHPKKHHPKNHHHHPKLSSVHGSFFFLRVTEVTSLYQTWRFLGLGQTMNIYIKQK